MNREFDIKHSVGSANSDEKLIAKALQTQQELKSFPSEADVIEKACNTNMDVNEFGRELNSNRNKRQQLQQSAQHAAKEATLRQKKRIDFLKKPENKVCHICGTRGHVAKECQSEQKKKNIKRRTLLYKKKLIKQNKFKIDLDGEYKRLNAKIAELEKVVKQYRDNGCISVQQPSKETDGGKVPQSTAQETDLDNKPAVTQSNVSVSERVAQFVEPQDLYQTVADPEDNYLRTKAYFERKDREAKEKETLLPVDAQSVEKVLFYGKVACAITFAIMLLLLLHGILSLVVTLASYLDPRPLIACVVNVTMFTFNMVADANYIRWTSYVVSPNKAALFAILCGIGFIVLIVRRFFYKLCSMMEWRCLESYREQLKIQGVTQRLPYKTSQIGTADFSFTSKAAYEQCRRNTFAALTVVDAFICMFKSVLLVLRDIRGLGRHVYCITRGLLRRRLIPLFFRYIIPGIKNMVLIIIKCFFMMVVSTCRYYKISIPVCLAVLIVIGYTGDYKYFSVIVNWVCQLERTVLAEHASFAGMVSFRTRCITQLTTAIPTFSRLSTIIYGLFSRILGMFKHN